MIDETQQELAIAYLLGELKGPESARFAQQVAADPELQRLVRELEQTFGDMALAAPPVAPPAGVAKRLFAKIRGERKVIAFPFIPWAMAAVLAVSCTILGLAYGRIAPSYDALRKTAAAAESELAAQRQKASTAEAEALALRQKAVAAEGEIQRLTELAERYRKQSDLSEMKIATLSSQVQSYAAALAVVVWDTEKQEGLVKLSKLPKLQAGKDYQLWVIDPAYKQPVIAGVVALDSTGAARTLFKPARQIRGVDLFAVSIEKAGGASAPQGQIILTGK